MLSGTTSAQDVQLSLLPSQPPEIDGYDIASICIPTYEIGGDYFDYIKLDEKHFGIVIADVSGDGIPAALIMSAFRALLFNQIKINNNPAELMTGLNKLIPDVSRKRDFITSVYAKLNLKDHICNYTNCGHNPPLLLRTDGKLELLERGGAALNILPDSNYESESVKINPGDQIIFYTDGVTEIFDSQSNEYGFERLKKVIIDSKENTASEMIDNILQSTKNFSKSELYRDDFTIIVLKRKKE